MNKVAELGEKIVGQWLENKGYIILNYRWRCRWGEIDIIATNEREQVTIFVEVKTRSLYNWDENGLLAITDKKQEKIKMTAAMFLSENPHLAELPCRFDVALVSYQYKKQKYEFKIKDYIESAF